jgi:hypothetical protein
MVKGRNLDSFYFTKKTRIAFRKLKKCFKLAFIFRLYNSKFPIRFETDASEFIVKIIILQLFLTENNKGKIIIFDYVLIAEINERGKKLRLLRYKNFNYNKSV